jgi:hypothetical protein
MPASDQLPVTLCHDLFRCRPLTIMRSGVRVFAIPTCCSMTLRIAPSRLRLAVTPHTSSYHRGGLGRRRSDTGYCVSLVEYGWRWPEREPCDQQSTESVHQPAMTPKLSPEKRRLLPVNPRKVRQSVSACLIPISEPLEGFERNKPAGARGPAYHQSCFRSPLTTASPPWPRKLPRSKR